MHHVNLPLSDRTEVTFSNDGNNELNLRWQVQQLAGPQQQRTSSMR